jgi:hypothetical protein
MKTLIALINSQNRAAYADAQRETWIPLMPPGEVDYRFFLGPSEREPRSDEVFLNCDDSYQGLPNKVQEVIRWALARDYDFVVKCDDDVVLIPDRFLASNFRNFDFTGNNNGDGRKLSTPWGFCYILSKRAMKVVENAPLPYTNNDELWIATLLAEKGITLHSDYRYRLHLGRRQDFIEMPKGWKDPSSRIIKRPVFPLGGEVDCRCFVHCMYIPWLGFHATPDHRVVKEIKRVFAELMQNAVQTKQHTP